MDDNKKKALAAALGQIERQFGKGAVMRMGDHDRQAIPAISTGSLGLDIALALAACQKAVSLKSTALNLPVKPP
ncbi:recombinase A [Pseudomonas fluorescens]|uniref:Recombinase A n=1 Tax=Pseudomonas fluorescens TaxID=294 RepID=A0A8B4I2K8_PSEFL|nr:recombinase A [Pseudomonas fluorescens]